MANQDRVGFILIERAIRLVGNAKRRKRYTAVEIQRLIRAKFNHWTVGIRRFLTFRCFISGRSGGFGHIGADWRRVLLKQIGA